MFKRLSILLVLAPAVAFSASDADKLKQLQQSLTQSKAKTEQLEGTIQQNSKAIGALQDKASTIAKEVQWAEARLSQRERELANVTTELKQAESDYATRKSDYSRTIRSLLRMRELPTTAYFTKPENMQQMMRTAAVMEATSASLSKKAAELSSEIKRLSAIRTRAEAANRAVKNDQSRLKQEQVKLASEVGKRQALLKDLRGDYAQEKARVAALSKQAKTVQELIAKLDTKPPVTTGFKRMSVGGGRAPLAGTVLHRFGQKKNANETWRGMVFRGRPSGTVVAPHDGEVVFTGPFRDYGSMVLLRHGNGYISLLAGLGRVDVGLNQGVRAGEPLGAMPTTGNSELYVELRENSKTIDPARWFAKLPSSLARQ
ncbi:MAG: peptidoglycan DD-metalloendopeptidase family protein [Alphaproteobacteria bacterium]|nr:peptidoglycan DD-metalloendopeptidase family protein [Alphaproteobacteria bacterium]